MMSIGKLAKTMDQLASAFAATGFEKDPLRKTLWTCAACDYATNYSKRTGCHKCG